MSEFIQYSKTKQFKDIVRHVKQMVTFVGVGEDGKAVYDNTRPLPTISFTGTVKIHGTNAGVCYDPATGDIWAQSRKNVVTPEKDNAGWAFFVESNKDEFEEIFEYHESFNPEGEGIITLYGEWAGGNIQKGVGVNGLDKFFCIFSVRQGEEWYTVSNYHTYPSVHIHRSMDFTNFRLPIDFSCPEESQNTLGELTLSVEESCPVAKALGGEGIGEGIVWEGEYKGEKLLFKVKGEKHSSSKVRTLAPVDEELLRNVKEFTEYAVTESRMDQAIENVVTMEGLELEKKHLGDLLRWVFNDILSEEIEAMKANNLDPKSIGKSVSTKARTYFIKKMEEL